MLFSLLAEFKSTPSEVHSVSSISYTFGSRFEISSFIIEKLNYSLSFYLCI